MVFMNLSFLPLATTFVCFIFVARFLLLYQTDLIHVFREWANWIQDWIHVHQRFRVPELDENGQQNMFYHKVYRYVNSLHSVEDSDFTNLVSANNSNDIVLHLENHQVVRDTFIGATISWTWTNRRRPSESESDSDSTRTPSFLLKIKKADKRRILRPYLQHIHTVSDDLERRTRETKLFINSRPSNYGCTGRWASIPFAHPSTFDTLVMDGDLKIKIKSDLDAFLKSEQYYHKKLGRVWKRSYLLHGPSGTGKSSFIAAMANYLCFDVYDVDLSGISDDSDLKMLLLQAPSKSIIVIEDLDRRCVDENSKVSLPGMLNFMDGIVNSCCGGAKIMVFTVNSKEMIDAAMLRPGRIDVHIQFPLCDFNSFKSLANNYLGVKEHKLFPQVEEMFQSGASISPAEVGELMLVNRSSPSRALKSVISALQSTAGEGKSLTFKLPRKSTESTSSSPLPHSFPAMEEQGSGTWREAVPTRDFRKLYGLFRLKSDKKFGPSDPDASVIQR